MARIRDNGRWNFVINFAIILIHEHTDVLFSTFLVFAVPRPSKCDCEDVERKNPESFLVLKTLAVEICLDFGPRVLRSSEVIQ